MNNCVVCGLQAKYADEGGLIFPCCESVECLKKTFRYILVQNQNLYNTVQQSKKQMTINVMLAQAKMQSALDHSTAEIRRLREDRDYYRDKYDERSGTRKRSMNRTRYFDHGKKAKYEREEGELEEEYIPLDG